MLCPMPKLPFDPDEEELLAQLDCEEYYPEETFGDRLGLFYRQFNGATRTLLGEALFREALAPQGGMRLEILCPSPIIYRRLQPKRQKIVNEVRWIWPEHMVEVWLGLVRRPEVESVFSLR